PTYWIRPPQTLSAEAGMQRFVWNLHYAPPEGTERTYPISAIYRDTPSSPMGPAVMPGEDTVKLTAGGRSDSRPLVVKMDPRVKTPMEGLAQQFGLSMQVYEGLQQIHEAREEARKLRAQLKALQDRAGPGDLANAIATLDGEAAAIEGAGGGRG